MEANCPILHGTTTNQGYIQNAANVAFLKNGSETIDVIKEDLRRVTVVVPTHNDESSSNFYNSLKQWQARDEENRRVVFVDDGSTIRHNWPRGRFGIKEILEEKGFTVIPSHPEGKNVGKGWAVLAGLKHARDVHGSGVAVLLDADVRNLKPEMIEQMTAELGPPERKEPYDMVVGAYQEKTGEHMIPDGKDGFNKTMTVYTRLPIIVLQCTILAAKSNQVKGAYPVID